MTNNLNIHGVENIEVIKYMMSDGSWTATITIHQIGLNSFQISLFSDTEGQLVFH